MAKEKLNPRHELFIEGVLAGKTQTQAYIDAGYSEKYADSNASKLTGNHRILQEIERRQSEREEANKIIDQRARAELHAKKGKVLAKLVDLALNADSEMVSCMACRAFLDMAGMKEEKVEVSGEIKVITEVVRSNNAQTSE